MAENFSKEEAYAHSMLLDKINRLEKTVADLHMALELATNGGPY
jgi:hypothetical protein